MPGTGKVIEGERELGIAFPFTSRLAVTAAHVVRGHEEASLAFVPDGAPPVTIDRVQRHPTLDVAVLDLGADVPAFLRWTRARRTQRWRVEARWLENDPLLTGEVDADRRSIGHGDGETEMIQLRSFVLTGDFHGYSGSPVTDDEDRVIGVLTEQLPIRGRARFGETKQGTNVLYAIPIADVIEHFDLVTEYVPPADHEGVARLKRAFGSEPASAQRTRHWANSAPFQHDQGARIQQVAFSPDGALLATGGSDKTVRLWRLAEDDELGAPLRHPESLRDFVFSGDSKRLVTVTGAAVAVWAVPDLGEPVWTHKYEDDLLDLSLSPDGRFLATAAGTGSSLVREVEGHETATLPEHVFGVAFSPDGRRLAAYAINGVIHLWRIAGGQLRRHFRVQAGSDVKKLKFSPAGRWLISVVEGGPDTMSGYGHPQTVCVYDPDNGNRIGFVQHGAEVKQVAVSSDDRLVASASHDKTACVWPIGTDMEPVSLEHKNAVDDVSFAPGGSFLAIASWEEGARVWHLEGDAGPETLPHQDNNIRAVRVSREGLIATVTEDSAYIWRPSP